MIENEFYKSVDDVLDCDGNGYNIEVMIMMGNFFVICVLKKKS